ncbi:MAG: phage/plasmid primase, P4 family, partial [Planctomycetota bacterium]|nr:phage/plasmid primase, P4 family [Planctomycetota bacterium]
VEADAHHRGPGRGRRRTPHRAVPAGARRHDPHRLARIFIDGLRPSRPEGSSILFWRGQFYIWNGRSFHPCPGGDPELKARLTKSIKAEFDRLNIEDIQNSPPTPGMDPPKAMRVTTPIVRDAFAALQSQSLLDGSIDQPAWLASEVQPYSSDPEFDFSARKPKDFVSMKNGILDLKLLVDPNPPEFRDSFFPHTPLFFTHASIPYDFNSELSDENCPKWMQFLQTAFEGDEDRIATWQEWCGLNLTWNTSYQKFMILEGSGSNGKTVACAALEAMLGPKNVSQVKLENFRDKFALHGARGMLANIAFEVGELEKADEQTLKTFTGGDRMMTEQKFKDAVSTAPTARLTLCYNNRPHFTDRSDGLWRRMLILPMNAKIQDHQKVIDMDKPEWWEASGELPAMFNWAVAGLARLYEKKRFTESAISAKALAEYRLEANPIAQFLRLHVYYRDGGELITSEAYKKYREWIIEAGKKPFAREIFGKEISRAFPEAIHGKIHVSIGCRLNGYKGLCLTTEGSFPDEDNPDLGLVGIDIPDAM